MKKKSFITLGQLNALRFALPKNKPSGITMELLRRYNGTSYGVKLFKATDYNEDTKETTVMYFIYATNYKDKSKSTVYQYENEIKANFKFDALVPYESQKHVESHKELTDIIAKCIKIRGL